MARCGPTQAVDAGQPLAAVVPQVFHWAQVILNGGVLPQDAWDTLRRCWRAMRSSSFRAGGPALKPLLIAFAVGLADLSRLDGPVLCALSPAQGP